MTTVVCPKCGAKAVEDRGTSAFEDQEKCIDLKGTKYLDPAQVPTAGISWCPNLSDAAPADWVLLPPSLRQQVLDNIAEARSAEKK
jgi:hypothetical protein